MDYLNLTLISCLLPINISLYQSTFIISIKCSLVHKKQQHIEKLPELHFKCIITLKIVHEVDEHKVNKY